MSRLAKARKAKKLRLDEAAQLTGISQSYLEALEQGQLDRIPAPYRRPYLEQYQKFLEPTRPRRGEDSLLDALGELDGPQGDTVRTETVTDPLETATGGMSGTMRLRGDEIPVLRLLAGSFMLTLLGLLGFKVVQVVTNTSNPVEEEATAVAAPPEPPIPAEPAPAEPEPTPAPGEEPAPEPTPAVPQDVHNLTIRTIHPVRVDAKVGDSTVHSGFVGGGQVITVGGAGDIVVDIGDLSRVHIEYNGGRIEPLHNLSSARRLVFVRASP